MRHTLKSSHRRAAGIGLAVIMLAATTVAALASVGLTSFEATPGPLAAEITVNGLPAPSRTVSLSRPGFALGAGVSSAMASYLSAR